jgi:nitric oxide reductase activation protein
MHHVLIPFADGKRGIELRVAELQHQLESSEKARDSLVRQVQEQAQCLQACEELQQQVRELDGLHRAQKDVCQKLGYLSCVCVCVRMCVCW